MFDYSNLSEDGEPAACVVQAAANSVSNAALSPSTILEQSSVGHSASKVRTPLPLATGGPVPQPLKDATQIPVPAEDASRPPRTSDALRILDEDQRSRR